MQYWILRIIIKIFFKCFLRLKIEGEENIPRDTNFIVVSNHTSFLDVLILGVVIPYKIYFISARFVYKIKAIRWFLKMTYHIPIGGNTTMTALEFLDSNKVVGIFPEGRISRDGSLKEFRRGVAVLALRSGRPVLPCAIIGANKALPVGKVFPRWYSIKIKIGKPLYFIKEFSPVLDDVLIQRECRRIRKAVEKLLWE